MKFMSTHGFRVIMISSKPKTEKEIAEIEAKEQAQFVAVNMTRSITPISDFFALLKLLIALRKIKPQIIHTHTPKAGLLGMFAAWLLQTPIRLHTVAGLPLMVERGTKRKVLTYVEKLTYKFAHQVLPNSEVLKNFVVENRLCSENKLLVIGNGSSNGIDTRHFDTSLELKEKAVEIRNEYRIRKDQFIFVFVGRVVKDKGVNELIAAFVTLYEKHNSSVLLIVGPFEHELDPVDDKSIDLIKRHKNIICTGYKDDVRPYLVASQVLVLPSYREGFPNVVMQAGSLGLPCIVSDINGCNEIIENEVNGLIVPAKDRQMLLTAMTRIAEEKELWRRLAMNARPMIVKRYSQDILWGKIKNNYERLLQEKTIGKVSKKVHTD